MATILDVGLVQYFQVIYPVLFVFALVLALLQKTKALGQNSLAINAIIATAVSFMILLSDTAVKLLNFMIPWFVVAAIFFVLLLLLYQIFGVQEKDLVSAVKDKAVLYVIIGIAIVIMLAGFANVFGQTLLGEAAQVEDTVTEGGVATGSFQQNIYSTLFHPKVLGLIIMFAIAVAAVALLSG